MKQMYLFSFFFIVAVVFAGNGQIDIASIPYTINQSGSYVLVNNVSTSSLTDGISISASNVTLDLNGHTISGPGFATGLGSAVKIYLSASNVSLKNGMIKGWNGRGVSASVLTSGVVIENITVSDSSYGLYLECKSALIRNCQFEDNANYGVFSGESNTITGCISVRNSIGFYARLGSVLKNNVSMSNRSYGYSVAGDGTVCNNTAINNDAAGIYVSSGSYLLNNQSINNGGSISASNHSGIRVSNNCVVSGNYCKGNASYGILATGSGNVIKENMSCLNVICGVRTLAGNAVINNQASDNGDSGFSLSGSTESGNLSF